MIPYLKHDMSIPNSNAMLTGYTWDTCGFILTLGFIPLLTINIMAYVFVSLKIKQLKILYFLPSFICLIILSHYLFIATNWKEEPIKEAITAVKCSIDGKNYNYQIFQEDNGDYSVGVDNGDKIPLSVIDYTNKDTIIETIENYYKSKGGMCP
jgi:hypothetical protein